MSSRAIVTAGLTRTFSGLRAVDQLDLNVPHGAIYGFLGPNGAGKTTSIRMLLGLLRPTAGTIELLGTTLHFGDPRPLRKVGALVESPSLYGHLTGRENLAVQALYLNVSRVAVDRSLELVDLSRDADRTVRTYSLGMRQRLGLAQALLGEPELLILDEPTNGLDPAGMNDMRSFLRALPGKSGVTVFLSSHLLSEVEHIASHIGILHNGRLLFQGTIDELHAVEGVHVTVEAQPMEVAERFLQEIGFPTARLGDGQLSVRVEHRDDAIRVNRSLIEAGLDVSHVSVSRRSLEEIFLSLTGSPDRVTEDR
ncbi:MAG: hypothetical protein A3C56_03525 [Ignavibacteria bacterium RIFCSPHIGHO2_02_FULL_56_12]|nr:MAG: hypothetical protein A3C56_03525 [Ignavibacteria bacterium RIFCSPHIGHO2_02_FULL_56_12]